ncbi:alpha/beta hydrolase [Rhizobium sp. LCM 4573]|uniref:PHA/PHB synthase family protein n=1 Tax=Rhizobium sp. LCM 4573 TaxID=1848291 RepID=UPI0008D9C460|nr:class I poly(R)-hydroxyalkanoic acid synthase [Rhizobium sp. LCM 4573]OHV81675.1 class I poly(R)-hydroxyalkanoic acid synthase [Rhizobium sp. LCM 4573]
MAQKTGETGQSGQDFPGFDPKTVEAYMVKDPHALAMNLARALENLGKAASEWLRPRERGEVSDSIADPVTDLVKTMSNVAEYWMSDPKRTLDAQTMLLSSYMGIWMRTLDRLSGQPGDEEAEPPRKDKRFADEDWTKNPFFSFLKQTYLVTADWADRLVTEAEGLDDHTRHKAAFYVKQITAALSPANFVLTNPEVYRETIATSGANLVEGMRMLAEDIATGGGEFRLRQTDQSSFAVGRNLAVTPGKVIARNEVCEILQYEPSTETVLKRPLLICPPWINKFYILDLTPQKSFIKWCVDQGHTVFVISWVNPDERHASKDWESYIREGIDFALETIEKATDEKKVNAIGYCVGGTLLAAALALHAQEKDRRIASVTFLTAQVDFTHAGDLKVFVDEEQLAVIEKQMDALGYLEGSRMAVAFNMLRASELIWPYVVSNYLMGQEPLPFDLLYWNSDSTRMAAANHAYYLRNCYLSNNLSKGEMKLAGKVISLKDINIPIYNLATRDDHIAPAKSVFTGSSLFGGPVEFVLAGSGHIAGVVNPPEKQKYQYWTGGSSHQERYEDWLSTASETKGSWWPHWHAWVEARDADRVPARKPGGDALEAIADAPGTYVLARA